MTRIDLYVLFFLVSQFFLTPEIGVIASFTNRSFPNITLDASTEVSVSVYTFITTVSTSGFETLEIPDGETSDPVTLSGPAAYTTEYSVASGFPTWIAPAPTPYIYTFTETLGVGSITFEEPVGTGNTLVTLLGPTTYIATLTADPGNTRISVEPFLNTADPHCHQTLPTNISHLITFAQTLTTLSEGETYTTTIPPVISGSEEFTWVSDGETFTSLFLPQSILASYLPSVQEIITGPTAIVTTFVAGINQIEDPDSTPGEGDPLPPDPAVVCFGACGRCEILFPTVHVYYWPVPSPNTACLTAQYAATAAVSQANLSIYTAAAVQPRGLSKLTDTVSTLVNPDGFTFTSPSVYVAFPTISARDNCGTLGSIHTSVTLGYAPEDISTGVWEDGYFSYFRFNFSDAQCPPASQNALSIVGQTGYNPFISPLPNLSLLDPAWNAQCFAANFQGNDPPHALVPANNLSPFTTSLDPTVTIMPASPSSGVPVLPIQTEEPTAPKAGTSQSSIDYVNPSNPPLGATIESLSATQIDSSLNTQGTHVASDPDGSWTNDPLLTKSTDPPTTNEGPLQTLNPAATELPNVLTESQSIDVIIDSASGIEIDSQILKPGGSPITISNTPISLASSADYVVIGSATQVLPEHTPIPAVFTLGTQLFSVNSGSAFIIGTQTLVPGARITVSGTLISLADSGSYILEGSSTIPLLPPPPTPLTTPELFTFAGQVYTANAASASASPGYIIIDSQTLVAGAPAITISGTPISLPAPPQSADVTGTTSTQLSGGMLASLIMSGFNFGATPPPGTLTTSTTVSPFEGGAVGRKKGIDRRLLVGMVVVTIVFYSV